MKTFGISVPAKYQPIYKRIKNMGAAEMLERLPSSYNKDLKNLKDEFKKNSGQDLTYNHQFHEWLPYLSLKSQEILLSIMDDGLRQVKWFNPSESIGKSMSSFKSVDDMLNEMTGGTRTGAMYAEPIDAMFLGSVMGVEEEEEFNFGFRSQQGSSGQTQEDDLDALNNPAAPKGTPFNDDRNGMVFEAEDDNDEENQESKTEEEARKFLDSKMKSLTKKGRINNSWWIPEHNAIINLPFAGGFQFHNYTIMPQFGIKYAYDKKSNSIIIKPRWFDKPENSDFDITLENAKKLYDMAQKAQTASETTASEFKQIEAHFDIKIPQEIKDKYIKQAGKIAARRWGAKPVQPTFISLVTGESLEDDQDIDSKENDDFDADDAKRKDHDDDDRDGMKFNQDIEEAKSTFPDKAKPYIKIYKDLYKKSLAKSLTKDSEYTANSFDWRDSLPKMPGEHGWIAGFSFNTKDEKDEDEGSSIQIVVHSNGFVDFKFITYAENPRDTVAYKFIKPIADKFGKPDQEYRLSGGLYSINWSFYHDKNQEENESLIDEEKKIPEIAKPQIKTYKDAVKKLLAKGYIDQYKADLALDLVYKMNLRGLGFESSGFRAQLDFSYPKSKDDPEKEYAELAIMVSAETGLVDLTYRDEQETSNSDAWKAIQSLFSKYGSPTKYQHGAYVLNWTLNTAKQRGLDDSLEEAKSGYPTEVAPYIQLYKAIFKKAKTKNLLQSYSDPTMEYQSRLKSFNSPGWFGSMSFNTTQEGDEDSEELGQLQFVITENGVGKINFAVAADDPWKTKVWEFLKPALSKFGKPKNETRNGNMNYLSWFFDVDKED